MVAACRYPLHLTETQAYQPGTEAVFEGSLRVLIRLFFWAEFYLKKNQKNLVLESQKKKITENLSKSEDFSVNSFLHLNSICHSYS